MEAAFICRAAISRVDEGRVAVASGVLSDARKAKKAASLSRAETSATPGRWKRVAAGAPRRAWRQGGMEAIRASPNGTDGGGAERAKRCTGRSRRRQVRRSGTRILLVKRERERPKLASWRGMAGRVPCMRIAVPLI